MTECAGAEAECAFAHKVHDFGCVLMTAIELNLHVDAFVVRHPRFDRADLRLDSAHGVVVVHRHANE